MKPNFVAMGAAGAALGVALGAFGAHSLRGFVGPAELALWETATRYWFIAALGTLAYGIFRDQSPRSPVPGWLMLSGGALFAGSLYALALGAPRVLGAITPLGGLCLIAGFVGFAISARRRA